MKFKNKILLFLLFLVIAMFAAIPGFAQTGNIRGKVTDIDGKPMVDATISVDRQGITQHFEVKTDNRGRYLHAGLPAGQYQISVMRDGKKAMTQPGVVRFGGNTAVDFDLRQAAAQGISELARQKAAEVKAKAEATLAAFEQARTAMISKNWDEAIRLFKEAADMDPTEHVIFANLADAYAQAKKYDDAAAAYNRAIELKPDQEAYYNNLGMVQAYAGKIDAATKALQKAAELNPPDAGQIYYNLGAVLTNRGWTKEGADAFKKATEYNPQLAQAYYQLGISYFRDDALKAIDALQKFQELVAALPKDQQAPFANDVEAAKQLIEAANRTPSKIRK